MLVGEVGNYVDLTYEERTEGFDTRFLLGLKYKNVTSNHFIDQISRISFMLYIFLNFFHHL